MTWEAFSEARKVSRRALVDDSHLGEVGDAQEEANGVQYVGFATPIESSDGIEERIKATYLRPLGVGFESVENYLLYIHVACSF